MKAAMVLGAVAASIGAVAVPPPEPAGWLMDRVRLSEFRGGNFYYCALCVNRSNQRTECLPNGNGGYIKYDNTQVQSMKESIGCHLGNPTPTCDLTSNSCGGLAINFTDAACMDYDPDRGVVACGRTYHTGTSGVAWGVSCSSCP